MNYKNFRVQVRALMTGSVAVLIVLVTLVTWAIGSNRAAVEHAMLASDAYADVLPAPLYLVDLRTVVGNYLRKQITRDQALAQRNAVVDAYKKRTDHWRRQNSDLLKILLLGNADERAQDLIRAVDGALALDQAGVSPEQFVSRMNELNSVFMAHRKEVDAVAAETARLSVQAYESYEANTRMLYISCMVLAGLVTIATVAMCLHMNSRYKRETGAEPMEIVRLAQSLQDGYLGQIDAVHARAVRGSIMHAIATLDARLRDHIAQANASVSQAAGHAQASITMLMQSQARMAGSARSLRQAADDSQVLASGLQMMSVNAQDLETDCSGVGQSLEVVLQLADEINGMSSQASTEVGSMADLSQQMLDIARRASILGINASVEAARAGSGSNGFKAVASDLQSLALNASVAAKKMFGTSSSAKSMLARIEHSSAQQSTSIADLAGRLDALETRGRLLHEQSLAPAQQAETITARLNDVCSDSASAVSATEQSAREIGRASLACQTLDSVLGHFKLIASAGAAQGDAAASERTGQDPGEAQASALADETQASALADVPQGQEFVPDVEDVGSHALAMPPEPCLADCDRDRALPA